MPRPPLDIENPSTGEPFGTVAASDDAQITAAVAAAYEAFGAWRRTPAEQRAAALRDVRTEWKRTSNGWPP